MTALIEPFAYQYMTNALWVSGLVGALCGMISAFLTLRGWSLFGDALSHSVVPGVAGAYILGLPLILGALISGFLATGAMLFFAGQTRLKEDAVVGIIFTGFFGLGLFMISIWPIAVSPQDIVLGNILTIAPQDAAQLVVISVLSLGVFVLKWRDFVLAFFDQNHAQALGLRPALLRGVFFTVVALATIAAMQTVGALLVVAMVITPGATASLLTRQIGKMIILSGIIGASTSFLGAYLSFFLNGATGGIIVVLQLCLFLAVFMFAPQHGFVAQRRLHG